MKKWRVSWREWRVMDVAGKDEEDAYSNALAEACEDDVQNRVCEDISLIEGGCSGCSPHAVNTGPCEDCIEEKKGGGL